MVLSPVGRKKTAGHVIFLVFDIIVLALSSRVNQFQDFFYVADLFPLALSSVSLVIVTLLITLDFCLDDSFTGRPQSEVGLFGVLSIFWLAFNAFSTSRWAQVPSQCKTIPQDLADERMWCNHVQALKAFVWLTFLICLGITLFTLRFAVSQYKQGNKHIFQMPLSRYRPESKPNEGVYTGRGSEFLQFEKLT